MNTSSQPLRAGVAGLGRSGWGIHAACMEKLPEQFAIAAICDPRPERRDEAVQRFGCTACETPEALFADASLDLVVVATPNQLHVQHATAALNAGRNVLVEKPLASSAAEVDGLIKTAAAKGRVLAPFQNRRYEPVFRKVQQVIDSGVLGRIVQIRMAVHAFARRWDWQTLKKFNGGSLTNTGPHFIDQALQLFGDATPDVFCQLDRTLTSGDADDHVKLILHKPGSPTVEVEITACCAFPQDPWLVMGTTGGLRGNFASLNWKWVDFGTMPERPVQPDPTPNREYLSEKIEWHEESWVLADQPPVDPTQAFYLDLYRTLREGKPLIVTPESVRRQIAVIETCQKNCPL